MWRIRTGTWKSNGKSSRHGMSCEPIPIRQEIGRYHIKKENCGACLHLVASYVAILSSDDGTYTFDISLFRVGSLGFTDTFLQLCNIGSQG